MKVLKNLVNVAVVNFHSIWGNKDATLKKIERYVTKASEKKANIVVFPELALTGYDVEPEAKMHKRAAETIPGPSTNRIANLANKHNIYVIFGIPERDPNDGAKIYNSAAIVRPDGGVGA
ncbi:MAG: carbon-nitrogen hydrolase family protein, partial [Candidatus Bathyarchaeia archaeon]